MEKSVHFRDVVRADASLVTEHRFAGSVGHDEERAAYETWVAERILNGTYLGRIATLGGEPIGGAGIVLLDWGPTRGNVGGVCARIVGVFTSPAQRRQGVATQLVGQVMGQAHALGVRDFRLASAATAGGLYRKLGFEMYAAEMVCKLTT